MLDAAMEARAFTEGCSREDLDHNRLLALALLKCIEIIGEAASRISPITQAGHPELPWADIIGMRNRLIHAYFDIDLDLVWDTVTIDLPPLIAMLQAALAASPDES
jgi:uncharacterized protein with HEPN domain